MTGGKSGSPGPGVPANQIWWRILLSLAMAVILIGLLLSPAALVDYLINGKL